VSPPYKMRMHAPLASPVFDRRERLAFMGEVITIRLDAADTAGALAVIEHEMPLGLATPLHVHPNEDETLVVVDGVLTVHLGGRSLRATRDDLVWLPRGVPHAFRVDSDTASVLAFATPAGHEAFFRAAGDALGAPAGPPDLERITRAAADAGFEILGPPPFDDR
jgi:quercetin dioxygenase-like cupin family protein